VAEQRSSLIASATLVQHIKRIRIGENSVGLNEEEQETKGTRRRTRTRRK